MSTPEERKLKQQEAELIAKHRELRLRELEIEIYEEQKAINPEALPDKAPAPLYQTRKHKPQVNSIQKLGRKIINYAKFAVFMVAGIAIVKAGFFIGMSITYLFMMGIIAAIGYQIFIRED
jgi:hypothetical protein